MSLLDFIPCFILAVASGYFVAINWYAQAVFSALCFFLLLVNVVLHYVSHPLPRFVIGELTVTPDKEE